MSNKKKKKEDILIEQVLNGTYKGEMEQRLEKRDANLRKQADMREQLDIAPVKREVNIPAPGGRGKDEQSAFGKAWDAVKGVGGNLLMGVEGTIPKATEFITEASKYGAKKASSFVIDKVLGVAGVEDEKAGTISKVLGGFVGNTAVEISPIGQTNRELNSEEKQQWRQETIQENTENALKAGKAGQWANDLALGVGDNAIQTLLFFVPGGQIPSVALSVASAGGSYLQDAEQRGMNEDEKMAYATTMALWEGGGDAVQNFALGGLFKLAGKGEVFTKQFAKSVLGNVALNAGQEGITEPVQELTADIIGDYGDWENMPERMAWSASIGAGQALLMGGAGAGINSAIYTVNVTNNTTQAIQTAEQQLGRELTAEETTQIENQVKEAVKAKMIDTDGMTDEEKAEIERLAGLSIEDMALEVTKQVADSGKVDTEKILSGVKEAIGEQTKAPTAEDVQAQIAEKEAELAQSQDQREQQIIQDELDVLQEEASNIPVKDERTQSEKMTESKKEAKQIVDEIERNLELEQQAETEQEQQQIRDRINELETQLAPLQEQLEESNSNTYANEIAELERIRGNISNETIQKFIDDKINSLKQDSRVEEQTTPASQEVVEQASAESLQTTTDEVIENNPLNVDENTPLSNDIAVSEDTTDVTKRIKDTFGLKPKETKELYDKVAKANSVEQTRKILEDYKDIKETVKDDRVKEAREYIRSIKKDVNSFKHNVTDYKDFYRKNGRKLNIGNDGMSFDTFYQELSSQFPEYFDSDVLTLEDQLEAVTDFMNNNQEKYSQTIYEFNDAELNSLAEELYTDVHAKEFEKGTDYKKSLKDLDSVVDQEALKEEIIEEVKNQVNSITSELAELKKMLKDTVTTIQETKPIEAQANDTTNGTNITVAPYYNTYITNENFDEIKGKIEKEFIGKATEFSNLFGAKIKNISTNIGGFTFQEGELAGEKVKELSYTFELDNVSPDDADMIASLLGDLGHEQQEAVISANYLDASNTSDSAILEFSVSVKDSKGVDEVLKKLGIDDYTIDTTNNTIKILEFDPSNMDATLDLMEKLAIELGGNYNGTQESKIESRYIDREARREIYKNWLATHKISKQNRKFSNYVEQALQKLTENTNKIDLTESKTRDENGNLENYYHGTRGDFETFDNSKIGQNYEDNWSILGRGFYFTKNYDEAKEYGASSINEGDVNVKEGFLNIKNPFYASEMANNDSTILAEIKEKYGLEDSDFSDGYNLVRALRNKGVDSTAVLQEYGYDGIIADDESVIFDGSQMVGTDYVDTPSQTSENGQINNVNTEVNKDVLPTPNVPVNSNMDVTEGKQRSWAKTSTESEVLKRQIQLNDLDVEKINYIPITNKTTLSETNAQLNSLGYDKALESFKSTITSGKRVTAKEITMGQRLIQEALKKGDKNTAIDLLQDVAILETELGQAVQASSIIQRMTPAGQLKMLEKMVDRAKVKGDKSFDTVQLTDEMKNKILDTFNEDGVTYDQDKLNATMEEVKQEIADQMGVTTLEKVNSWRYFAMLGNPKTHIRNFVSNIANMTTIKAKNAVARTIETIAPIENRTKTWKQSSQEIKDYSAQVALDMKDTILGEDAVGEMSSLKQKRKIFESEFMNKITNFNGDLMQKEDWFVSKPAFKNALQEFLTANNINTMEDIQNNPELVEKGKAYALEQSQIAMFRQYSWLANQIRAIENKNIATNIAVGSILPFKKTPINIAKAGLAYSPLGFTKTLTYDIAQVKKGNMEASTLVDHLAQNITGTGLTLAGYMLASLGFLRGGGEEDEESKYDSQLGDQKYSLKIGDTSYSLSWLSPVAMPLFVGTNFYEQLVEDKEWSGDLVLETLGQTLDPLNEMSFLSSFTRVLSSYDTGFGKFLGMFESMGQNYLTQFIPTLSSQVAGAMDDTKRTTIVGSDSDFKAFDQTINSLKYKIPVLRETLEPSLDIWGNEIKQSENVLQRAFESFIAPYSAKTSTATEIDENIKEVFNATGDSGVIPNAPKKSIKFENEDYDMSAKEYTAYKKQYGQTANDMLEDLFRTTAYRKSDSTEKARMINEVYTYASDEAKKTQLSKEGITYTNATEDKEKVYRENAIKGAIEKDMYLDEFKMYRDNPEKYEFLQEREISYEEYESKKEEYNYYYKSPKNYAIGTTIGDFETSKNIMEGLGDIKSIDGERRPYVEEYISNLPLEPIQKSILLRKEYKSYRADNNEIINYVNSLPKSFKEKKEILEALDMKVDDDGTVWWE